MKEFSNYRARLDELGLRRTEHVLIAELGEKILVHWEGGEAVARYPVSSGKRPRSCKADSLGTPWGLHAVAARHGDGEPEGMVFIGRKATGQRWMDRQDAGPGQKTLVTTRILRLRGLEPGLNAGPGIDSHDRYIYIHGTNHPEQFPENLSAGCLLMRDADLIALFEAVPEGSHVWLSPPPDAVAKPG